MTPRTTSPLSLAARLTAWYVGSAFLLVLLATGSLYAAMVRHLDREDDAFLADKMHLLLTLSEDGGHDSPAFRRVLAEQQRLGPIYVRLFVGNRLVAESPDFPPALDAEASPRTTFPPGGHYEPREIETADGRAYRVAVSLPHRDPSKRQIFMAFDRTREEEILSIYRRNLAIVLGVALLVSAAAGYAVTRRGLRPVAEVADAARRVRLTTLHQHLILDRLPAELADLATTFNAMLDRLADSFRRLDRFAADIAHELRTPINNLRGEAEVALSRPRDGEAYHRVLESSLEEYARLTRLVDSLLFLARAGAANVPLTTEPVDVAIELRALRDFYAAAADDRGVTLATELTEGIRADLDRTLFQRAVGNLVANALAHTPAGGTVTIATSQGEETVRVEVRDTGEGIAAEHLPHVFDRFYRADAARSSAPGRVGLGLALVKCIAELHAGSVALESVRGQGTRATLVFPLVSAAADSQGN